MSLRLLTGHVMERLAELPAESVHCVVTSPPYYGLRDYGIEPQVWGGEAQCGHEWGDALTAERRAFGADFVNANGCSMGVKKREGGTVSQGAFCRHCNAWRGSLGLEPTLGLYIDHMVEVFRAVRRVLRNDGTVWLNVGDSYNADKWGGGGANTGKHTRKPDGTVASWEAVRRRWSGNGFKPKDLMQIPSRLAQRLQEPYYTGRIKSEGDRRWLAATIDGEGCIFINRQPTGSKSGRTQRTQDCFDIGISVSQKKPKLLEECARIAGLGKPRKADEDHWEWRIYSQQARQLLRELYPHFVIKQHEARIAIGCPSSGEKGTEAWIALKAIHKDQDTFVDFPAPESLYEPGWWVRSDIAWCKRAPMPESVTDRPTTAWEHVFLLTRSAKYFYDAEAVKEEGSGRTPGNKVPQKIDASRNDGGINGIYAAQQRPQHDRNMRNFWLLGPEAFPEAHFATFPTEIPRRAILAGTSARGVCPKCAAPWERVLADTADYAAFKAAHRGRRGGMRSNDPAMLGLTRGTTNPSVAAERTTTGWRPTCKCAAANPVPATVLDPFLGAGTTAMVADRLGRDCIGIDLSPAYAEMAQRRFRDDAGMFAQIAAE
jgi:DNA modification methylase